MTRNIYNAGYILFTLILLTAIFDRILNVWMGMDFYGGRDWATRSSFINWYFVENIVSLAGSAFLIKYYHSKSYQVSFWTAIIAATTTTCFVAVVILLLTMHTSFQSLYAPLMFVNLVSNLVHAASLILSKSRSVCG